ncbi:hypothetical protein DVH24_006068 [Malus domestica]|uniref:4-coumarate--CoA ligase n=1 Tax=Malus domestica TaxID=3750 RepID=A0A498J0R7_MALDO|nr:hypothetical protein DVH24_006068 [Malus domestica]
MDVLRKLESDLPFFLLIPCIIKGANGDIYTYTDVEPKSRRVASGLNKLGIQQVDVIMLFLPNFPEFVFAFLGASFCSAMTTAANPFFTHAEILKQANASKAKLITTLTCYYDKVKDLSSSSHDSHDVRLMCVDSLPDTSCSHFSELFQADESDMLEVDISLDDVIALPYSSGTTGLPKRVMLEYEYEFEHDIRASYSVMLTHKGLVTSVVLFVPPLFHIYSLNSVLLCGLRARAAILMMNKFEIVSQLGLIDK